MKQSTHWFFISHFYHVRSNVPSKNYIDDIGVADLTTMADDVFEPVEAHVSSVIFMV